jgi:hypothetical protein
VRFLVLALIALGCASSTGVDTMDRRDAAPSTDGGPAPIDAGTPADDLGPTPRDLGPPPADAPSCAAGETRCGSRCADLQSDPSDCGACGRSCVVTNASAACVAGSCDVGTCDAGYLDCDGDAINGCETPDDCAAGAACTTSCGSTGSTACADRCAPSCEPPAESCNAADDDCDGDCDEGALAGCRVGVHRSYGDGSHFYTTDLSEANTAPYSLEYADFFYLYASATTGTRAFYRCLKTNGRRFYTTSSACEGGGTSEGVLGYIADSEVCGSRPLFRLYRDGSHFYTTSAGERDNAVSNGWLYESIAGHVWSAP